MLFFLKSIDLSKTMKKSKNTREFANFEIDLSLYPGKIEGDLLKCNTYATFFWTLHFYEVKVLYIFAKIVFLFVLSRSGASQASQASQPNGYMDLVSEPGYTPES